MTPKNSKSSKSCKIYFILRFWHQKRVRDIKRKTHAKYELRSASFRMVKVENTSFFVFSFFPELFLHFLMFFECFHGLLIMQITLNIISRWYPSYFIIYNHIKNYLNIFLFLFLNVWLSALYSASGGKKSCFFIQVPTASSARGRREGFPKITKKIGKTKLFWSKTIKFLMLKFVRYQIRNQRKISHRIE